MGAALLLDTVCPAASPAALFRVNASFQWQDWGGSQAGAFNTSVLSGSFVLPDGTGEYGSGCYSSSGSCGAAVQDNALVMPDLVEVTNRPYYLNNSDMARTVGGFGQDPSGVDPSTYTVNAGAVAEYTSFIYHSHDNSLWFWKKASASDSLRITLASDLNSLNATNQITSIQWCSQDEEGPGATDISVTAVCANPIQALGGSLNSEDVVSVPSPQLYLGLVPFIALLLAKSRRNLDATFKQVSLSRPALPRPWSKRRTDPHGLRELA